MSRICSDRTEFVGGAQPIGASRRLAVDRVTLALLAVLVLAGVGSAAVAQVPDAPDRACESELSAVHRRVAGDPTGLAAARLLRAAVESVEPALPPVRGAGVPDEARDHADAAWLAERRLLPQGWSPSRLDPEAWKGALDAWRADYRLGPMTTEGATAPRALTLDLTRALHDLRGAVRPLGLIAYEGDAVVFNGIIWNFTPHPRFLLARPPRLHGVRTAEGAAETDAADGPAENGAEASDGSRDTRFARALELLSSCARPVDEYLTLPSDIALDLFLSAPESTMILVASEPNRSERWPVRVARADATPVFRFTSPAVEGVDMVAVEFEGPSMSVGRVLAFLGRMGGNVRVGELFHFLQFP